MKENEKYLTPETDVVRLETGNTILEGSPKVKGTSIDNYEYSDVSSSIWG